MKGLRRRRRGGKRWNGGVATHQSSVGSGLRSFSQGLGFQLSEWLTAEGAEERELERNIGESAWLFQSKKPGPEQRLRASGCEGGGRRVEKRGSGGKTWVLGTELQPELGADRLRGQKD